MVLLYDGSFEGFLSVVFECYSSKIDPTDICSLKNFQQTMFVEKTTIATDCAHAERVWTGLLKKMRPVINQMPYTAFISEDMGIELALFHFIQQAFASPVPIDGNFGDADVLFVRKSAKKVMQEAKRMLQFIRFQRTLDDIYFAPISPLFDILPLILNHFKNRFADQKWLIYDIKRDYGYYYNEMKEIEEVVLNDKNFNTQNGEIPVDQLQENEAIYQSLWKGYCKSTAIKERMNLKLQRQFMPKRYWKFLPEKN